MCLIMNELCVDIFNGNLQYNFVVIYGILYPLDETQDVGRGRVNSSLHE